MGKAAKTVRLSDAAGGRPAGRLAVRSHLTRFLKDQSGATAIEYGLIISLIFLVCVTAIGSFAGNNNANYNKISTAIAGTR